MASQEIQKTLNEKFEDQIAKRFPDKSAKILVACSDGRSYSMEALETLDEMGYTNLVGLKGGYYAWFRVFDNKLNRRWEPPFFSPPLLQKVAGGTPFFPPKVAAGNPFFPPTKVAGGNPSGP